MKLFLAVLAALAATCLAGRAFPVESEMFVTDLFQGINPRIEWDPTNYLVDLSGQYSLCKYSYNRGPMNVEEKTREGATIGGLSDYTQGFSTDSESVQLYIKEAMPRWTSDEAFAAQIRSAQKFGCSVQPGCKGYVVIACLFSPSFGGVPVQPTIPSDNLQNPTPHPNAEAFTPEQYKVAEAILGREWDRFHTLENLSGFETSCGMIYQKNWLFTYARSEASARGIDIEGFSGASRNLGSTEDAMEQVLKGWAQEGGIRKFQGSQIGCSLISDCMYQGNMYVVVSCLVEA